MMFTPRPHPHPYFHSSPSEMSEVVENVRGASLNKGETDVNIFFDPQVPDIESLELQDSTIGHL